MTDKKIWELEDELVALAYCDDADAEARRKEIQDKLRRVRLQILAVKKSTLRLLLLKRIADRKKWSVIADELGYSESHIFKLRVLAVLALAGIEEEWANNTLDTSAGVV